MSGLSATSKKAMSVSASRDPASMLIVSTRKDGLGGRLLAMANAKALADRLGYRFGFTWSDRKITDEGSHTVDVVQNIFSSDFIERHWLGEKIKAANFRVLGDAAFTPSDLAAIAGRQSGWICNQFNAVDFFRDDGAEPVRRSDALRSFGFAPAVRQALEAAGKCPFPGPMAALHLRSGDIVHGSNRRRLIFADKVIPSTLGKAIVSELSLKGLTTLLIGQDRAMLDYLQTETGAMRTDDFGAGEFEEDETLRAFFEMALMASCEQIHAGKSIYAELASVLSAVPCTYVDALFSRARATEIILGEVQAHGSHYGPLECAFAYQWTFLTLEDEIKPAQARELLGKAQALDPENEAYGLKMAVAHYREGDPESGEAILESLMKTQWGARSKLPLPMLDIMTNLFGGWLALARDFDVFFAAAKAGHPYAMACSAYIMHEVLGEKSSAVETAARLVKMEPANPIFREIRRRVRWGKKPKTGRLAKAIWRLRRIKGHWL
ncbi:hypothetical protein [Mesorhizobium sp. ES1-1]|uniref:hypothetical protein n=1 Tax=Mesorhizobium sp. ES1-1 TaxID=2876629 RepID=UPI001CCAE399|nr:hypothetical protein [Mesorhizobium sp. ES1-1]MBZ9677515.1 hypothetical protein [Mesorhizobium sp. ES1-1]